MFHNIVYSFNWLFYAYPYAFSKPFNPAFKNLFVKGSSDYVPYFLTISSPGAPEEFKILVEKGIGMVLDTVHAMRSRVNPLDFIKHFRKKITEIHLTDGVEGTFAHSTIGSGKVNCLEVIKEYKKLVRAR